ncbi:MAG: oligosaccharide flippase family protein [Geobacteraceae bacterium]|nr:oligosaccharide flippase family protein [Geobacteraceae bacterium]
MDKKKILFNFSSYAFGNVLSIGAGLVSFPLFTRVLTVSEYGLLSLLNTALMLLTCLSKGGIQNSINRFWKSEEDNAELVATSYSGVIVCFSIVLLLTLPGFYWGWYGAEYNKFSLSVIAACYFTALFEIIRSVGNNIAIIEKKALLYSSLNIVHKYLRIILPFLGIMYFSSRMLGIATGFMIASLVTMLAVINKREFKVSFKYNRKLIISLLIFSFPLMLNELVNYVLNYCDRLFLAFYLDAAAVGMYSAAYNLSNNVEVVLITSMNMTTAPLLLDCFNRRGFDEMKYLLRRCLGWYCLLGSGIIALVVSIGPDLLVLLASSKYRAAGPVMLPVLLGVFLYGLYGMATSTLFFCNKTKIILALCTVATIINLFANWYLVPRLGIIGAAYATLLSFLFLGVTGMWLAYSDSFSELSKALLRLLPAIIMLYLLYLISMPGLILSIVIKSIVGTIVWVSVSFLLFSEVRSGVSGITAHLYNKLKSL